MAKLSVSLGQMHITHSDVRRNVKVAEEYIVEAARRGSHLILLPELWSTGYALENSRELASELNVGIFAQTATMATENKISVLGSMLEKRGSFLRAERTPDGRISQDPPVPADGRRSLASGWLSAAADGSAVGIDRCCHLL